MHEAPVAVHEAPEAGRLPARSCSSVALGWLVNVALALGTWGVVDAGVFVHFLYGAAVRHLLLALAGALLFAWLVVGVFAYLRGPASGDACGGAISDLRRGVRADETLPIDRRQALLIAILVLFALARLDQLRIAAQGRELASEAAIFAVVSGLGEALDHGSLRPPPRGTRVALTVTDPVECSLAPSQRQLTLAITFVAMTESTRPHAELHCVQAPTPGELLARTRALLQHRALALPMRLELFDRRAELPAEFFPLERVAFREHHDGVCAGTRCFVPSQLVTLGLFGAAPAIGRFAAPITPIAFDVLERRMRAREPLVKVSARSFHVDAAGRIIDVGPSAAQR